MHGEESPLTDCSGGSLQQEPGESLALVPVAESVETASLASSEAALAGPSSIVARSAPENEKDADSATPSAPSEKTKKASWKPVELRVAGSGAAWHRYPTLRAAEDFTGVRAADIKKLCATCHEHFLGWEFRWPDIDTTSNDNQDSSSKACDIDALARRIRAVPSAIRRRLVATLPETTRNALSQHLKAPPSPALRAAAPSVDLGDVISELPDVLRRVPQETRCKLLAGVRDLGARHRAILLAPDVATVARLLQEVVPAQRRTLLEALPEETQQALQAHMLGEKAAKDASVSAI